MKRKPSAAANPGKLVRPSVWRLHAYVPGEQPKIKGLIKLNTNENPYPPSAKVLRSIQAAVDGRLRLYPNPTAQALRQALAQHHRCRAENIVLGNGSDDLLALATRAFVEPATGSKRENSSRCRVQYFIPSYSLYPVLADIHGARRNPVPLGENFQLPKVAELRADQAWDFDAALTLITTPNAPSGRGYRTADLDALCRVQRGVVVLDEAYVDFAQEHALSLALRYPHVLVARTFSKAYSLCFLRVGYFVGDARLIAALDKVRDSYNVNGLAQVGAMATLRDLPYYHRNFRRIIRTRTRLAAALEKLGFEVIPSQTNFILVRPPEFAAQAWMRELRARKILVRWFDAPEIRPYLRITVGTNAEADALVAAARQILRD